MFRIERKLANIYTVVKFLNQNIIVTNKETNSLEAYSLNETSLLWTSNKKDYSCTCVNNIIATTNLHFYNLLGISIHETSYREWFELEFSDEIDKILYKTVDEEQEIAFYHVFNTVTMTFTNKYLKLKFPLFFVNNVFLVCQCSSTELSLFNFEVSGNIWQKEFTELLKYQYDGKEKTGEIKQVKLYKDSLIVVSDGGVIRLLLETGEIVWKNNAYARTMEIVGEIGYVCAGLSLYKVNLETGEIIRYGYNNNYNRLPDIEYQGSSYWPIGHEVIYHEGLLWYAVFSSGESFVVAINPYDGKYEWIHHVDTYEKIESIQFHDNKMFLLDTGYDLHIYKKQKE